ncbi:conserved hypothetical protein [Planktothrix serta PCC 8927]|uniref:Uncharacterized protein n=1 Tax=Planktothrix serta PCC 8927 TaxID=671068 RepID=A0A7Z9C2N2_9CYAN|nr:hypothetical protein [Planktothrix serta]VXD24478.1 conserved hypothetical protein [Planktothrix serta PCC 8927]
MKSGIFRLVSNIGSFVTLTQLQVKRFFAVFLIGFILLNTTIDLQNHDRSNPVSQERIDKIAHQKDSDRPKTTGEFLNEAEGDVPLNERLGNITRDSAEAFKDLGSEYSGRSQKTGDRLKDNTAEAGKSFIDKILP